MESHPPARAARVSSLASTHQGQGIPAKHRAIHPNLHTTIPPMPVVFPVANLSKYDRLDLIRGGTRREDLGRVGQGPRPARPPVQDR